MRLGIYGTGGSGREVFDMIEMNPSLKKCWDQSKRGPLCNAE